MSQIPDNTPGDRTIRISAEDVASSHVDDLLRRQASLRGERGIAANRTQRWYYRNWFVFMIAGLIGALVAWALIEPHFRDSPYFQGAITEIDTKGYPRSEIELGGAHLKLPEVADSHLRLPHTKFTARLTINKETIYMLETTREVQGGRGVAVADPHQLNVGQEVGVYLNRHDDIDESDNAPVDLNQAAPDGRARAKLHGGDFVVHAERPHLATHIDLSPATRSVPMESIRQEEAASFVFTLLLLPAVAGAVGLCIGAIDGIICRLPRRVFLSGGVGLLVGLIGGFVFQFLAALIYAPLNHLAQQQLSEHGHLSTLGFLTQVSGRAVAWCLAGAAMGLGQGIALRSGRLLLYGLLGGAIGGLLGGLLFDPIDLLLIGGDKVSAALSRMIGLGVIGATVGAMIGVVELLARDAWLQMLEGPLAGKEFLIFKDLVYVGTSPRSDIYLFNDDQVASRHAIVRAVADNYEIEASDPEHPLLLNGRGVQRARLRHGDQITLGRTVFSLPVQTHRLTSHDQDPPAMSSEAKPETVVAACSHCGKKLRVPSAYVGKSGRCPACSKVFVIAAEHAPQVAKAGPKPLLAVVADATPVRQKPMPVVAPSSPTCGICQSPIASGEAIFDCPRCRARYHDECWKYNGGCGAYGCEQAPVTERLTNLEIPASHWGREDKACPNCGQSIMAAAVRCRHCGATFNSAAPEAAHSYSQHMALRKKIPAVRTTTIWLLVFSFIPCTAPLAAVIGLIWYLSHRRIIDALPPLHSALAKIALGVAWLQTVLLIVFGFLASFNRGIGP